MRLVRTAVAAIIAVAALTTVSAQTGSITVRVVDSNGDPLPAATVTISHALKYVAETAVLTNKNGIAEFPVLKPGSGYRVSVVFPGFAPTALTDLTVHSGETNNQVVQLSDEIVERVKVVAKSDVVDLDQTSQSTKFSDEFIQDLPVPGRFYQNMLTLAPGVQDADGDGNPNVHGSRDRDFKAMVSGISNVDPLTGQQMGQVNPNSIEELEVITAGAGVEYSRAQGGFANVLQKQGSNEFEGVFDLLWRTSKLDGQGANDFNNVVQPDFQTVQPALQISGPIVKDRLWYILSHELIDNQDPRPTVRGIDVVTDSRWVHSDKVTWQVSPRNKLAFQYQSDPRTIDNFGIDTFTPPDSAYHVEQAASTYSVVWTAPYSPKILIDTRAAWQDNNLFYEPMVLNQTNNCVSGNATLEQANCFNTETSSFSGSAFETSNDHRQRLTVRGDATLFAGRFLGASHQVKLGMSVENERYARDLIRRPDILFVVVTLADNQTDPDQEPGRVGIPFGDFPTPQQSEVTARGITWGFYASDEFKPRQNVTVTLGLRVDREEIRSDGHSTLDPEGESLEFQNLLANGIIGPQASQYSFTKYEAIRDFFTQLAASIEQPFNALWTNSAQVTRDSTSWFKTRTPQNIDLANTNVSPRLSVAWDPWSNGKTKIAATAGRYYNSLTLNIPLLELEPPEATLSFNTINQGSTFVLNSNDLLRNSVNPAVNIQAVDHNLKTPYNDEFTLQVEREVARETSLKVSYIRRRFRDQLQDYDLNHVPGDYGRCVTQRTFTQPAIVPVQPGDPDYNPAYGQGDGIIDDCIGKIETVDTGNPDEVGILQRPDGTADLYVQNPGWADILYVSNVNSIDYDGYTFEINRRQYRNWQMTASYTWSRAFGDGEDFTQSIGNDRSLVQDEQGYQAYDRRHQVRVSATTITPWGIRLGGTLSWQSGLPYSLLLRAPAFDAIPPVYQTLNPGTPARNRTSYLTGQRNDQRNEPYWLVDMRLAKELNLGRGMNMQLSAEIFNVLNDGTYIVYDPQNQTGEQINGANNFTRNFGRRWQLGLSLSF